MRQFYNFILASIFILGGIGTSFAQTGNTCATAIPFDVVINDCQYQVLNNSGLSNSGVLPTGCQPNGFNGGDLWLSITMPPSGEVTAQGSLNLTPPIDFNMDINMQVWQGTCGSLTPLACDNDDGAGFYPSATFSATPGSTVYIQLWDLGNNQFSDYDFCVSGSPTCTSPSATFNEVCDGNNQYSVDVNITNLGDASEVNITNDGGAPAINGVNSTGTYNVGPFTLGDVVNITVEHAEDASCNISYEATDVGSTCPNILSCGNPLNQTYCYGNNDNTAFLYTSPFGSEISLTFLSGLIQSPQDEISIYDGTDDSGALLYNGSAGGDLTSVGPFNAPSGSIYLVVDSDVGGSCSDGSLGLGGGWEWEVDCATNSDCEGAIAISSHTGCSSNFNNGDLSGAVAGASQCSGTGNNPELWYSFTAQSSTQFIRVSGGSSFDPVVELWGSCGGPVLECKNDNGVGTEEYFWRTDFVVGQEYKLRVYHEGSAALNDPVISVDVFHISEVQLKSNYCNNTYSTSGLLKATWPTPRCRNNAPYSYQWRFTDTSSGTTYGPYEIVGYDSSLPNWLLSQFPEIEPGATYNVEVRIEGFEDGLYGDWGPSCPITIEGGIQTGLQPQYNGGTFGLCDVIKAIPIGGATQYVWEIEDLDSGEEFNYVSSTYVLQLNNTIPSPLNMNANYDVRVYVSVANGPLSTISLPGTISTAIPSVTLSSVPVSCGSNVGIGQWAQSMNVCGAESYTFQLTNLDDPNIVLTQTQSSRVIIFNNPGLFAGDWDIRVFASIGGVDGSYGPACTLHFLEQSSDGIGGIVAGPDFDVANLKAELSVYPNPAPTGTQINVVLNNLEEKSQNIQVEIYDMTGKLVYSKNHGNASARFQSTINLENKITTGVYLVQTRVDGVLLDTDKLFIK